MDNILFCKKCDKEVDKFAGFELCSRCYKERWRRSNNIPERGSKSKQPCQECGSIPSVGKNLCIRCYSKLQRKINGESLRKYGREYDQKHQFGANPEIIKRRETNGCSLCGMTNTESLMIYRRKLSVHHKDGRGRLHEYPNHDITNLIVVCRGCHNKLHDRTNGRIKA